MARLASAEKAQFYPTPDHIAALLAEWVNLSELKIGRKGTLRIIDPSCGEGKALWAFKEALQAKYPDVPMTTTGVELSKKRAARAGELLDLVIDAPVEVCDNRPSNVPVASIIFGNPPYDVEEAQSTSTYRGQSSRLERLHLKKITPWIADDGILIWIIPYRALDQEMARFLDMNYYNVQFRRFGDSDGVDGFGIFGQVIILAQKLAEEQEYDYQAIKRWVEYHGMYSGGYGHDQKAQVRLHTAILDSPTEEDELLTTRTVRASANVKRLNYTAEEIVLAAVAEQPIWDQAVEVVFSETLGSERPVMSPGMGHIAQMVASGFTGVMHVGGALFKGRAVKRQVEMRDPNHKDRILVRDKWDTNIVYVDKDGLQHLQEPGEVGAFLIKYADLFADFIKKNFPAYGEGPKSSSKQHAKEFEAEMAHLATLSHDKLLPGAAETGLAPRQKDWTIGLARSLEKNGAAHMIGEMGVGKTRVSAAVVDLKNLYPAVITCPPHMVVKWQREIEGAIPGAKAVICEKLHELTAVMDLYDNGGLPHKLFVILSRSYMKMGPGWQPAVLKKQTVVSMRYSEYYIGVRAPAENIKNLEYLLAKWKRHNFDLFHGRYVTDENDQAQWICADRRIDANKRHMKTLSLKRYGETVWEKADSWDYRRHDGPKREKNKVAVHQPVCPDCGESIAASMEVDYLEVETRMTKKPLRCIAPKPRWNGQAYSIWRGQSHAEGQHRCGAALWQFQTGAERWPLAHYIRKHKKGWFQSYIADEVHQYKAKGSDQGWAFAELCSAVPNVITLTGTFFGGYSTSIFYLLYRTQKNIRRVFGFHDAMQWAQQFGVLQHSYKEKQVTSWSAHNAKPRTKTGVKEMPGLAPAAVQFFLSTAVFGRVKDLGIPLPAYREELIYYALNEREEKDYERVWAYTWGKLLEHMPKYTSAWLQWCLARPNSMFRDEIIDCPLDESELVCPSVLQDEDGNLIDPAKPLLTKEEALVAMVKAELSKGRNVVIYLRQTGTRDIRTRLVDILARNGITQVSVLDSGVTPKKREAWLEKNQKQVLITNPKLVETGLDLVQYSTVIFYEIEYSLYTLWQSMRRVWRPGQTLPVDVKFMVARGTLEAQAISLISKKLKAGQLVHGEDVTAAIVKDEGSVSLVEELITAMKAKMVDEEVPSFDGIEETTELFGDADGELETTAPTGSLTRAEVVIEQTDMDKFIAENSERLSKAKKRRKVVAPTDQISMF